MKPNFIPQKIQQHALITHLNILNYEFVKYRRVFERMADKWIPFMRYFDEKG